VDEIVSGGVSPLYTYTREPDGRDYQSSSLRGRHVPGENISVEVIATAWKKGVSPYRSNTAVLVDGKP
jgi:hypothetical protein